MNENKKLVMELGNSLKYVNSTSHIFNVKFFYFMTVETLLHEGSTIKRSRKSIRTDPD